MFIKYEVIGEKHIMSLEKMQAIKGIGSTKEKAFDDFVNSIYFYVNELKQLKLVNIGNIQEFKRLGNL